MSAGPEPDFRQRIRPSASSTVETSTLSDLVLNLEPEANFSSEFCVGTGNKSLASGFLISDIASIAFGRGYSSPSLFCDTPLAATS